MKYLLLALTFLTTANAYSASLDADVQEQVMQAVKENCSLYGLRSLSVESVDVRREKIDQGSFDFYYTITIGAATVRGNDPQWNEIVVEAVKLDIANPSIENIRVLSVSSPLICR